MVLLPFVGETFCPALIRFHAGVQDSTHYDVLHLDSLIGMVAGLHATDAPVLEGALGSTCRQLPDKVGDRVRPLR